MNNIPSGYKQTEVGVIPEDWEILPLCELGKFKNGINKSSESFGHGSPFVNLMDVFGVSSISSSDSLGLVDTNTTEQQLYDLRKGDVIFIRSSVKPSGVGLTAVVERDLLKTVFSGFLIRFRDSGTMDIGFKRHCFYGENFRGRVIAASSVSANTNINQDNLKKLILPIPPTKSEQGAIAEALSDTDALIESLEQLITKKRHLKQGAMQELLTGKKRLPGFSGEWEVKRLGDAIDALEAGISVNSVDVESGDKFILKTSSVVNGSFLADECKTIAPRDAKRAQLNPRKDTIIISRMNTPDLVGECGYVDKDYPHLFLPDRLWMTRFNRASGINGRWLSYLLSTTEYKLRIKAAATGTSGSMKNLSKTAILSLLVCFPLPAEQTAIATILTDMDAEITTLETKLAKTRQLKQGMMHNLLTGRIRLI
jgi:type I restriction enzyme S subunit